MLTHVFLSLAELFLPYLLRDWARSHFYFFAWVDNCNPPNKLWLLLAFFLLKIFCFTLYKDRSEIPSNFKSCMHRNPDSSVYRVQTLFRQPLDQSGKTFALFTHSSNPKIASSSQHQKLNSTNLSTNCSKSECDITVNGP